MKAFVIYLLVGLTYGLNTYVEKIQHASKTLNLTNCIVCTPLVTSVLTIPAHIHPYSMIKLQGIHNCFSNGTCYLGRGHEHRQYWTNVTAQRLPSLFAHTIPALNYWCLINSSSLQGKMPNVLCNYTYDIQSRNWTVLQGSYVINQTATSIACANKMFCNRTLTTSYVTSTNLTLTNLTFVFSLCQFNASSIQAITAMPTACSSLKALNNPIFPFSQTYALYHNLTSLQSLRLGDYLLCDNILYTYLPSCYKFCTLVQLNLFDLIIPLDGTSHGSNSQKRRKRDVSSTSFSALTGDDQALQLALDYINSTYPMTKTRLDALSATGWLPFAGSAIAAEMGMSIRRLQSLLHVVTHELDIAITALQEEIDDTARYAMHTRMAVDFMLAQSGGVCSIVNDTSCCSLIRNQSIIVKNAMQRILSLARIEVSDYRGILDTSWWDSITGWFGSLSPWLKGLVSIVIVFIVVILLLLCLIPCCMKLCGNMMTKITNTTMITHREHVNIYPGHGQTKERMACNKIYSKINHE
ncbi:uncharacterized protein LOC115463053 [Microcaecilia unicolor]|uniref:Uncharacterized protein LOC115463053 n=1 Tax=Microcaecilia unicolor TaxID=1415580 RepID=A0A6P7XEN0_9AMPH|nr:uncharacterized protein LOC115463053 [Microcaecilia unicolor]